MSQFSTASRKLAIGAALSALPGTPPGDPDLPQEPVFPGIPNPTDNPDLPQDEPVPPEVDDPPPDVVTPPVREPPVMPPPGRRVM